MKRSRVWENLPLGVKGLVVVAIPLVSLIAATVLSYLVTQQHSQQELYVASYLQKVHTDVQRILFLVQDAETGVRSYILTGEPPFLRRYHTAQEQLPTLLRSLEARRTELGDDRLGFDDPAAAGAADVLGRIPTLDALPVDLVRVARLIPERLEVLGQLVDYGEAKAEGSVSTPPTNLTDMLTGRVLIVQTLNHTSKHIQPQLLALADRAAEDQADRRSEQLRLIVIVALLGLIGGIAAVVIFTRTITRRVSLLESGAASLATGSEPSSLPSGRDAIGRLGKRVEETSHLLVEREGGLRAAKEEADRANQAKSDFLSRMSHELRTPLNGILGFGQLLQMENLKPRQKQDLDQIMKAGRHLLELINEVLDIASVEAGRLTMSIEPVSVAEVVNEAVGLLSPIAAERGVEVVAENVAGDIFVAGDRQRLKQVLLNLLSNAVKYNRSEGTVRVRVGTEDDRAVLSVIDTGMGIAEDRRERLFVPFDRLGAEDVEAEGTGLGLALSQRLVEAMQGTIVVESEVGKGSAFSVSLPMTVPGADAAALEPEEALVSRGDAAPRSLLYIEDNASNLRLVEQILMHRPSFSLQGAMQGRMGLDLAATNNFDLILLDLDLPDMAGLEVLQRLRADERTAAVPIVVVSADATPGQEERLLGAGAAAYVTKPFDVARFLTVLDEVLEDARVN